MGITFSPLLGGLIIGKVPSTAAEEDFSLEFATLLGGSDWEHFPDMLRLVQTEKVCLKGSPDLMWLETAKERMEGECEE